MALALGHSSVALRVVTAVALRQPETCFYILNPFWDAKRDIVWWGIWGEFCTFLGGVNQYDVGCWYNRVVDDLLGQV